MPDLPLTHRTSAHTAPKHISAEEQAQIYERQHKRYLHTNDSAWRKIRATQLRKEPLCRICRADGQITAANHVDHIDGNASTMESNRSDNLQSLCESCHNWKTALELLAKSKRINY